MNHPLAPLRLAVLSAAVLGTLAPAQAADGHEDPFLEELPTVLTASRLPQPIDEAPGAVTVIDREQIRATGYRDIARLFRLVPGMQVGQERGHSHWVTYHGMGNNYPSEMQVLIDGRSVYSPSAFGGMDWSALPLSVDEIERIEILRGTNSATYGANAFLGVINIITRHSAEAPGGVARINAGNQKIGDGMASGNFVSGPLSMRLSGVTKHDSGWEEMYDAHHVNVGSVRGDLRLSNIDELMFRLGASSFRRGEGYEGSTFGNNARRDASGQYYTLNLQWTRAPSAGTEFKLNYYRNRERLTDEWSGSAPGYPVVPLNRNRESTRDHLEFQHRFGFATSSQMVWGAELRRDEIESPFLYAGGTSPVDMSRLFANVEWRPLRPLSFNLGGAFERYSGEPLNFAPRAFANWKATNTDTFRIGYARSWAQRPTFEKEGDVRAIDPATGTLLVRPYVPNADVEQPRVDSAEIGYIGRFRPWSLSADVRIFDERIHGYIVRRPYTTPQNPSPVLGGTLGSAQYTNYGERVRLRGLEYELKFVPWGGSQWAFTHTLIDRDANNEDIEARTAPYAASLSWQQKWTSSWRTVLTAFRMGPMSGGDGFVPLYPYEARAYTTFDARIAYLTRIGGKQAEFSLNAINLGEHHQEIADRSQQANYPPGVPANPVSPMVYFSAQLEF
ncbi:MAG: TonB-dependent receptor plug domain-containing protein [Moraxellaceae bacterium]|nr:TonB-dependent receptor plug domain-containing protein [Moraxellaceae bacterium]